ncbi:MAG: hypothetical protein ACXVA2_25145 [Mucilaginibacter sp.]
MKKLFYLRIVTVLLLVLSAGSSFAQIKAKGKSTPKAQPDANFIVTKRALTAFETDFKGAANINWSKVDERFHVSFIMNRQKNAILYTGDGYMVYHVIFGFGKNLTKNVADQVNGEYPNCKIQTVFHVFQGRSDVWFVDLEQEKSLVQARVEDGLVMEDYRIRNQNIQ